MVLEFFNMCAHTGGLLVTLSGVKMIAPSCLCCNHVNNLVGINVFRCEWRQRFPCFIRSGGFLFIANEQYFIVTFSVRITTRKIQTKKSSIMFVLYVRELVVLSDFFRSTMLSRSMWSSCSSFTQTTLCSWTRSIMLSG